MIPAMRFAVPARILVKAPNWLGDIVLSLPALRALSGSLSDSSICVAGNETAGGVLSLSGLSLDYVHFDRHRGTSGTLSSGAVGRSSATEGGEQGGSGGWSGALRALRRLPWDVGVTFAESFSSALFLRLAGARQVIGYRTDFRGPLLSITLPRRRLGFRPHLVREFMGLAAAAGASPGDETPRLGSLEKALPEADQALRRAGIDPEGPLLGLCPGAAYGPSKRWPAERFSAVGKEIAAGGASVVVMGSRSEEPLAEAVTASIPGAVSLAGKTTIRLLAGIMARCAAVIANDSGSAHLAAAAGSGVVAIFGSTDVSWTRPLGSNVVVVKTSDMPCTPCFGKECDRGYACLLDITEREVAAAARAVAGGLLT